MTSFESNSNSFSRILVAGLIEANFISILEIIISDQGSEALSFIIYILNMKENVKKLLEAEAKAKAIIEKALADK